MPLPKMFARFGRSVPAAAPAPAAPPEAPAAPPDPSAALAEADRLVADGQVLAAVDLLAAANRDAPSELIERRLIELRRAAVRTVSSAGRDPWPPHYDDPFPDVHGRIPETDRAGLDADLLGGAVTNHGALVVRGLFGAAQVARSIEVIDAVEAVRHQDGDTIPDNRWYRPLAQVTPMLRDVVAGHGGTWLADSPAATAIVLDELEAAGATRAIAGHFGERPLFSLQKSTLRRSEPVYNFAGWHQDGSFLGPKARAMNVWVALTRCGGEHLTPGLELVPRRIEEILPTDGGLGSASIADASVLRAALDTPPVHPEFAPGDAILFDERFLHRTHLVPDMTHPRYALECWFFAPSFAADSYVSFIA